MKKDIKKKLSLEEEIAILKAENRKLRCDKVVNDHLVLMAKRDLNIDLKKNYEADVLKSLNLKKEDFM